MKGLLKKVMMHAYMAAKKSEIVFDHACTHFIGKVWFLISDNIIYLLSQCMSYTEQEKWFLIAISIFISHDFMHRELI